MAPRLRPSPAFVISLIALFVSIGGVGYAASKIGTNDIKNKAVTKPKIDKQAVVTNRIADLAVKSKKLADQSVTTDKIADQAVTTPKIADLAVDNAKLGDDSVTSSKIALSQVGADALGPTQLAVSANVNIAANGNAVASATCPAGTQVLSGGGTASSFLVHMVTSFQSGNGWIVAYRNTDAANAHTIQAIATCLSV